MVQDAEVKVRLKAEGYEETKQRLLETRAALVGVSSEQLQNAQNMRQAARDAQVLNNAESYKTRILLAQHPALNSLTRSMRDFGTVSRGILSITTAFSTAISAFNSTSSGLAQSEADVAEAQRHQLQAIKDFGAGSREAADATDELNAALAKRHEFLAQKQTEEITNTLNLVAAIGMIGSNAVTMIPKAVQLFGALKAAIVGSTIASTAYSGALIGMAATETGATVASTGLVAGLRSVWAALGQIGWIILGLSIAIPLLIEHWDEVVAAFSAGGKWLSSTFGPLLVQAWNFISDSIGKTWTGMKTGFVAFWNGMVAVANAAIGGILKGAEGLANGFISVINAIVAGYHRLAGILKLPRISGLNNVSIPYSPIPAIAAANGFDGNVNGPTMFLAGEAGAEHVSTSPSGKGGRTVVMNNYFHFEGSLRSSQEFKKDVDNAMKESLKRHGWT